MNKTEKSEQERKLAATNDLPILSVQPVSPTSPNQTSIGLGIAPEQKVETGHSLAKALHAKRLSKDGVGAALSDTPLPSAPSSPKM
jgi:6-phosphofructo-2-kinase